MYKSDNGSNDNSDVDDVDDDVSGMVDHLAGTFNINSR